ncbi:EAL domain-containing protein [Shinella sp. AETb1-6]|uniref:Diguanylate cyclase (GGDEF)-like protein n=1 Tax=Shinella granuli TaxID=323621 RepID=A0A4R2BWE6_SHIGR|nr:EAL domain-containing protein [Shinella sp. AETb1-6]TCN32208.1 diguanylate cyclase (GGDEF)-like protein [Shinella granuli]
MPGSNRHGVSAFIKRVEELVASSPEAYAILSVDIDHFRQISVSLSDEQADHLFRQLIGRLRLEVRAHDIVERTGRDGFAIFVSGVGSGNRVARLCERLLAAAHEPFPVDGNAVLIKLSIGVARQESPSVAIAELMRRADVALQFQKASGGSGFSAFTQTLDDELKRQQSIVGDLAAALDSEREIVVHYQPLFSREDLSLVGHEALVRWSHPRDGWRSPAEFLPQAEATGLIHPLGQIILDRAARAAHDHPDGFMAINVSPLQCRTAIFAQQAEARVRALGCRPEQFEIEVTEHVLLDDEQSAATLQDLRSRGFRIVLDDFGSGYCSLAYLRRFPVDKLKIDRQFISGLGEDEKSLKIVRAVVDLAHALGIRTTAEGIETQRQLDLLRDTDCDELQGYLLGRPSPMSGTMSAFGA